MKTFFIKTATLLGLFLLLQIPLSWTLSTIYERSSYRNEAVRSVAQSHAAEQVLLGPVLVVPVTRQYWEEVIDKDGIPHRKRATEYRTLSFLPEQLTVNSHLTVEERKRGIFPVPIYRGEISLQGHFKWPAQFGYSQSTDETITFGTPKLIVSVTDQHGIKNVGTLKWGVENLTFAAGTTLDLQESKGIHALLPLNADGGQQSFDINFTLAGSKSFSLVPIAKQNKVALRSNWPHPQFNGSQLPDERSINQKGFTATWQINELATNMKSQWTTCVYTNHCSALNEGFGVSLFESVDIYQQTTRAAKYGFLFLALTFAAFLLYEVLCQLAIHPVQYGLVGLALAVFFLLLLSFAEHIGFALAYLIAASSCITLLGFYLHAILKRWLRTGLFVSILGALYGAVYVILQLEDAALLTGSILLFALLALAMMITRKIDWYQWQKSTSPHVPIVQPVIPENH